MRSESLLLLISLLILGAPLNHAGRNSPWIWGVNRQGCRFSRPAPWMARGGGPPNPWRITGTPSLSEVPSGGARAFCLLLRFSKVSRCKSGTISSRYRRNGYVLGPIQHPGRPRGRHREQAPSHSQSRPPSTTRHKHISQQLTTRQPRQKQTLGKHLDTARVPAQ
jgi:hypothetical protein